MVRRPLSGISMRQGPGGAVVLYGNDGCYSSSSSDGCGGGEAAPDEACHARHLLRRVHRLCQGFTQPAPQVQHK